MYGKMYSFLYGLLLMFIKMYAILEIFFSDQTLSAYSTGQDKGKISYKHVSLLKSYNKEKPIYEMWRYKMNLRYYGTKYE